MQISSADDRKLFEDYRADLARFVRVRRRVVELAEKGKRKEAIKLTQTEGTAAAGAAIDNIHEEVQLLAKGGEIAARTAAEAYAVSRYWVSGLLAAAIVLGVTLLIAIPRSIAKPIHKNMAVLESLAERDLTKTLEVDSSDELGTMADALNLTDRSPAGYAPNDQRDGGAPGQRPRSAESARVQSDLTMQAATAMQEMSSTVQQISENSQQASEASKNAAEAARDGGKVVKETLSTMRGIAESTTSVAATITELGKNSQQIGNMVSVIDDIADQTNLLALNAAIEAARAGEQGRGFAVVAEEVRKLAERTTKATKELASMIEAIQKETRNAVQAMELGNKEVQVGVEKTAASGEALREIIKLAEQVGDMIATIATAATEQSATTGQINANVSEISGSIQASSSASEQTAKACTDLSSLAFDLQNLVNQFQLESGFESTLPRSAHKQGQSKSRGIPRKAAAARAGA